MEDQSPKPIRCKAAVCRAAGEPLVVEEIVVDPPKAYEIRIKIVCTSLCHSDITFWRGKVATTFPRILGHEAYGVVESVGEHVEGFAAGDTVVPTFMGQCDRCPGCASEHNNLCTTVPFVFGPGMRRDGTTRFRDAQGNPLHDLVAVSSFSEYTVVDVTQVVKIDPAVPPKLACLLSCGGSTGVGAAWRVAKVEPGSSVVIFGLGSVGLAVVQGAKMCGASKIIGVDMNPDKEEVGDREADRWWRRLQLRVHRRVVGDDRCLHKHQAGQGQDDHPGLGEGQRANLAAVPGPPVRQVRHGLLLRRAQAQNRRPDPRPEMHEQGVGAGWAGHA
ncbi:hypothetical protein PVAP13_9NG816700 [Panicum virgatum]|uniref:Alcohol dehydrogenase-like N-terminal domain-containing protein n=1 Tax=Panicum virgatum TaxID=38727 RepID=A0A8T0N3D3_PANVG|nr:hypothetical protein PVAP13_9NG816700 [Panicum virgatum]